PGKKGRCHKQGPGRGKKKSGRSSQGWGGECSDQILPTLAARPCFHPPLILSCPFSPRTRATSREEKNLQGFLEQPKEKWVESAFEVDGPHYFTVLALHILPPEQWRATRVEILRRLLVTSQARSVAPGGATRLTDKAVKDYSAYRSSLLFWALVDLIYNMFKKVPTSNTEGGWSCSLAEYIRHNDMPIYEAADKALKTFQEEFMPVETFSEFLDVAGLLSEITDPESFLKDLLNSVP
uniref:Ubiquitin protein ligase E3 component n-recognin 4 n=1 Tax=Cebus imitator TaxID=2715852 RepID=A0A2K5SII3_CEBIM